MTDIDWTDCPIVERDPEKMGGVPTLRAWRLSADSIVENSEDGLSTAEIADMFTVPVADVEALLAYAERGREKAHALSVRD
jgi:uncharacterized protein (DUF433 family)